MIYILTFFISVLLIRSGIRKEYNGSKGKQNNILIRLGLFVPCVTAALRATSVGSDVDYYVVPFFNRAVVSSSYQSYLLRIGGATADPAYALINFVLSRFTDNIAWLFFVVEVIIICFVYLGFKNMDSVADTWLSMLFFYFTFYNITLSTVRQSCACAIAFWAISRLIKNGFNRKNIIISLIIVFIAAQFHSTAYFSILLILIIYFAHIGRSMFAFFYSTVVICIAIKLFSASVFSILTRWMTFISIKYANDFFINSSGKGFTGYFSTILLGSIVLLIQIISFNNETNQLIKSKKRILVIFDMIFVVSMILISNFAFVPRIMYYLELSWGVSIAQINKVTRKDSKNQILSILIGIVIVMLYWYYYFCVAGVHGTFPYKFAI